MGVALHGHDCAHMESTAVAFFLRRLLGVRGIALTALLGALVLGWPATAIAWGPLAHRLIAESAQSRLSSEARVQVQRLLDLEPGSTLASVSMWADEQHTLATAPWHYVNFPPADRCVYRAEGSCLFGACVVGAIETQLGVLASDADDATRLTALKFVVHFVADVHQPLHAARAADRGGNTFMLNAFGRDTQLHAVWDSALVDQYPGGLPALRAAMDRSIGAPRAPGNAAGWAEESCRIVESEGFYPAMPAVGDVYAERWAATLVERLAWASDRLVEVLERVLVLRAVPR
jgi:hypothetical protein